MLTLHYAYQITKDRTVNGVKTRAKRYIYFVKGDKNLLAQLQEDVDDGFLGAYNDHSGRGLLFGSWTPIPEGTPLERNERSGKWYPNTDELDMLEALALRYPTLAKSIDLRERFSLKSAPKPVIEEDYNDSDDIRDESSDEPEESTAETSGDLADDLPF